MAFPVNMLISQEIYLNHSEKVVSTPRGKTEALQKHPAHKLELRRNSRALSLLRYKALVSSVAHSTKAESKSKKPIYDRRSYSPCKRRRTLFTGNTSTIKDH